MRVSIIICTCNRAADLRKTLESLAQVCVPPGLLVKLVVVDNASMDETMELVKSCRLPNMPVRYIHEPRRGKGYAYNTGMAQARGDVFLFTDDDVRLPCDWIGGMCNPILAGCADAVAGTVVLAPHLERPWMGTLQRSWLAATDWQGEDAGGLVGANMAFSRTVLSRVPQFDVELGPGMLGFFDETLFSWQLKNAGYRILASPLTVEHHCHPSRLLRKNYEVTAQKMGSSTAYIAHHWYHQDITATRLRVLKHKLQLAMLRLLIGRDTAQEEGMSEPEMRLLEEIYFYQHFAVEQKRPRNYEKHGLVKLPHSQSCQ